ncbi:MAG: hypothetical protein ABIR96_02795 [Bdellovibrionota bacterium]
MTLSRTTLLLAAATLTSVCEATPRKVISARFPVTSGEVSKTSSLALGAGTLEIDVSKADLQLIVWKVDAAYALEANIDIAHVNQSVLATDSSGKLLAKVTQLGAIPWIKVYLPDEAPHTLDVTCISRKQICQGVWKKFPFDSSKEMTIKIEANLRGLEGKVWSPVLNSLRLMNSTSETLGLKTKVLSPLYKTQPGASAARVRVSSLYDLLRMPKEFAKLNLLSVYDWTFLNADSLRETGFVKILYKTLFQADKGQFLLDTLANSTLQTQDFPEGRAFFASPGDVISFSSRKTKEAPESSLRALEFE